MAQGHFKGRLLHRGEPGYEAARVGRIFNKRVPARFPEAVLLAECEEDLVEAVRVARRTGWKIGIRSGGHSFPSWGLRDDGLLIDLGGYRDLSYDAESRIVSATPSIMGGAELNPFLKKYGRFFPGGSCPSVGIGGFLLQGGMGWNFRGWGYACERIVALDIVTADGQLVRADRRCNTDLFWAACGAGPGFFGLVTRFYLETLPLPGALTATVHIYRLDDYAKVLDWVWHLHPTLSEKISLIVSARNVTAPIRGHDGGPALSVTAIAFCDTAEEAEQLLAPLRRGPHRNDALLISGPQRVELDALAEQSDRNHPSDMHYRVDSAWLRGPRDAIVAACDRLVRDRPPGSLGGAFFVFKLPRSIPDIAMTLETELFVGSYLIFARSEDDEPMRRWSDEAMSTLLPYTAGQYWGDSDQQHRSVRCLTDEAWSRLQEIRAERDPDGIFVGYLSHEGGFDNANDWERQ